MTHNQLIACDSCNTEINLRSQIGHFDIPFNLYCPKCSTHISGKLVINQEKISLSLKLENAHEVDYRDNSFDVKYYIAELSAEFPTKKLHVRTLKEYDLPPFIRSSIFYGDEQKAIDATRNASGFAKYIKTDWAQTKSYFELYWHGHGSLLYPKLLTEIKKYKWISLSKVVNDLDAIMALHQLFLTTTGISHVLHPNSLPEYTEIAKLISSDKTQLNEILIFVKEGAFEFNNIEKRAFALIDALTKIYEQLIPVIALKNADCLGKVDREQFGIMTANFDELTNFYAKSYEWILDNIDIIIGLNNIAIRGQYSKCVNGKKYGDVLSINKYKKLEYIDVTEPFSKPTSSLKNRIRNAIQHFDNEIDYTSQKIVFEDRYAGKTNKEVLYLMDFATLCLENFSLIIYLLELVYNLRKVLCKSMGMIQSCTQNM